VASNFTDLTNEELDALITRVIDAKEHELALTPEDCQLLLDALLTLASMQEHLADNKVTIHKLRKLVGMVKSSETLKASLGQQQAQNKAKKTTTTPVKPAIDKVKPKVIHHKLDDLSKGDDCPKCDTGKLYKYEPATLLRMTGQSPFTPEQHVMERLRCNTCGAYFTASLSKEVMADGGAGQKYGYSARTLIALAKYAMGSPFYRQSRFQDLLGVPMSASTGFDQIEYLANDVHPVMKLLCLLAAAAQYYYLDDTRHRILDAKPIQKKKRNSNKMITRSGVYASGLIATLAEGHHIILFQTNIGHAGEFIDEILLRRQSGLPTPILMCDALSSNHPTVADVILALCNAHARRQFYDIINQFPEQVEHILTRYGVIWHNEKHIKEQRLSSDARLDYHHTHSLPVMEEIRDLGQNLLQLQDDTGKAPVEENSRLGKAIRYFLKHYEGVTRFCHVPGVALDNNWMEGELKRVALNRKNAMFYKTLAGAAISDTITSLIATADEAGVNGFDYFNVLQREHKEVAKHPEHYLPWNYQQRPGTS
jgi:hypothetical protein